jgi:WD40 repeat protein
MGVALSGDGQLLASSGFDGTAKLWEAPSGRLLATLQGHTSGVFAVALRRDGGLVASGSFDGTVKLWEALSGRLLATLQGHAGRFVMLRTPGQGPESLPAGTSPVWLVW